MNRNLKDLRTRFLNLNVWREGNKTALHKPLLVLWAIGRCLNGYDRMASYEDTEVALKKLLRRFGPYRKTVHPEYPFWHLQNDDVWEIQKDGPIALTKRGSAKPSSLKEQCAYGGFPPEVFNDLQVNKIDTLEIVYSLLQKNFSPTLHDAVLQAVNIDTLPEEYKFFEYNLVLRRVRDPQFSKKVLNAYQNRCAVCGLSLRLDDKPIGLEAAHIKWHCARGLDIIGNALSLCALHHRLFDEGTFTLSPKRKVWVARSHIASPLVTGVGFDDALGQFDQISIHKPTISDHLPKPEYLNWHYQMIFKADIRKFLESESKI